MRPPNILFIMADQFRFDATGRNGGWVRTQNLDRIADEGVNFISCYTSSPVCIPARVSLATGLYPHNTNVWSNREFTLAESAPTWMRLFRERGYRTSLFGKTHLHPHNTDLRKREYLLHAYGLDVIDEIGGPRICQFIMSHMTARWRERGLLESYRRDYRERFSTKPHLVRPSVLPLEEYADVYVASRAAEHLESLKGSDPWFCWLSFGGPHEPWDTPEPYAGMYDPQAMPPPILPSNEREEGARGGKLYELMGSLQHASAYAEPVSDVLEMTERDLTPGHAPTFEPGEVGRIRANYAGNVTLIDDQIGRVLDAIERRGELDDTIIVFTSDHGEMNGDYGLLYKENFLRSAVKVPLIIRTPGTLNDPRMRGASCGAPVEWIDLGPTMAELIGAEIRYRQFGRSLGPILRDPETRHRRDAMSEIHGEHMLADDRWKIALNTSAEAYLLFDLLDDPEERNNLAGQDEYRGIEDDLRLRVLERVASSHIDGEWNG